MAPKLTSMAEGVIIRLAADNRRRLGEALKSCLAGVAEATMQVAGEGVATRAQEPEGDDGSCRV